jgi:hypothetical protein
MILSDVARQWVTYSELPFTILLNNIVQQHVTIIMFRVNRPLGLRATPRVPLDHKTYLNDSDVVAVFEREVPLRRQVELLGPGHEDQVVRAQDVPDPVELGLANLCRS